MYKLVQLRTTAYEIYNDHSFTSPSLLLPTIVLREVTVDTNADYSHPLCETTYGN